MIPVIRVNEMYVTGIGRTKFGILDESLPELAYKAIHEALNDSKLSIFDIDMIYVSNFLGGPCENQLHLNSVISSLFPDYEVPVVRIETACASGGSALHQALLAQSNFDNVLVVGVEKMTNTPSKDISTNISMAGDQKLDQQAGLIFPANYALIAQQHMLKYGTMHEDLSLISLKNHTNANLNPLAHFNYKKVTMDMINASPMIASPLNLFDCSPVSDGAAAIIISKNRQDDRDVEIVGSALATDSISLTQRHDLTSFKAAKVASRVAFNQAKLTPSDLDVVEVHDCFTIAELIAMEDIGICKPGESKNLIRDGTTSLDGELPINADGGLKADGHPFGATGIAQVYEIVTQLRGEAGKRQVENANIGLTHNIGGIGGTATVHIFKGVLK